MTLLNKYENSYNKTYKKVSQTEPPRITRKQTTNVPQHGSRQPLHKQGNRSKADILTLHPDHHGYKLRIQKCFKIGNIHQKQPHSNIESYSAEATKSLYDAYLILGDLLGRDLVGEFEIGANKFKEPINIYRSENHQKSDYNRNYQNYESTDRSQSPVQKSKYQ